MPASGASSPGAVERPLIFISCGQFTDEEKALGKELERIVRESTPYDAYFAEAQNTLEGLTSHILSSLERCVGFVAVAHHRGKVRRPHDEIVRASVWVEQEIAIAAFIQHALKRQIEVALYLQRASSVKASVSNCGSRRSNSTPRPTSSTISSGGSLDGN